MKLVISSLWIGLGGCVGSIVRYLLGLWIHESFLSLRFSLGILCVNMVGCLCIGMLHGAWEHSPWVSDDVRLFLTVGVLGGFTTFSAFAYGVFEYLKDGELAMAFVSVVAHVAFGVLAVGIGYSLTH